MPNSPIALPPDVQRDLPPGTLLYGYDGEVVFRTRNTNDEFDRRMFTLLASTDDAARYERRWTGDPMQSTFLSVENFHGHLVRAYYFLFPGKEGPQSKDYRPACFAMMSLNTRQWLWVSNPNMMRLLMEGPMSLKEFGKGAAVGMAMSAFVPFVGASLFKNKIQKDTFQRQDKYASIIDRSVTHLRFLENQAQGTAGSGRL
jgi:hypothetical protein